MKPTELRIGNWVKHVMFDVEAPVNAIHLVNFYYKLNEAEPIPLTEDWLKRFGFKQLDKYSFVKGQHFIHHRKRGFVYGSKNRETNIKYVHQLQNLYHALTGDELKIEGE